MAKKSKEVQQRELEEKRKLRNKQIAQLRASNEMLEEAKSDIIRHYGEDSDTAKSLINDIDVAKDQNIERAETYLGSNKTELEQVKYDEVNPKEVEAYKKRLELRGITDEQIRQKDISNSNIVDEVEEKPKSKMEELMDKLKKLNNKTVEVEATVVEKPMSNSEFEEMAKKYKEQEAEELKNEDSENVSDKVETHTKVLSIEEVDPTLTYKLERQKTIKGFDPRDIDPNVQYDIIPLPSRGECYPSKQSSIPVRYLTAADENLITSPNLYNNGSLLDIILERTILDKRIRVGDLCAGDRDAIIIWLRATAYGADYPIVANNGKVEFKTTVDLSKLKYKEFNLEGDENGYFDYETGNGDKIKFKITSHQDDENLFEVMKHMFNETNTHDIRVYADKMLDCVYNVKTENDDNNVIAEMIQGIKEWCENVVKDNNLSDESVYNTTVTNRMIQFTVSVNGNTDRDFIKSYIENMRALEARKYREYVYGNVPGVDMKVKLQIPESQGGGSYETFLTFGETIFLY